MCISKSILFSLIDEDYNYINYYRGKDQQVFDYAVEKGYKITPKTFEKYKYVLGNSDSIMSSVIELDPNYIYYYYGNNEEIKKLTKDDLLKLKDYIETIDPKNKVFNKTKKQLKYQKIIMIIKI